MHHSPDPPEDIRVSFHTDAIAQEGNETLTLELVTTPGTNAPPSGNGVFFRNRITMTIVDNDGMIFLFLIKNSVILLYLSL